MELNLHANATTTPKVRAYIQRSKKPVAELVAELGVSETTVRRWRDRTTVTDRSHAPKTLTTSLSALEEALVCELRTQLQLPLDDVTEVMRRCVNAKLSRSAIHRCLVRHGLNRRPKPEKPAVGVFEQATVGFIHIDLKHLPALERRKSYAFVAIDRATRYVYLEIHPKRDAETAAGFLKRFLDHFPHPVHTILTDNGSEFTDRFAVDMKDKPKDRPSGRHPFDRICAQRKIDHRLTKPYKPQTNGLVERFNRRIVEAMGREPKRGIAHRRFASHADRDAFLNRFVHDYNRTRLKCLGYLAPLQTLNNPPGPNTLAGLRFSRWTMIPANLSFHDATIAAVEREGSSYVLHVEDVAVDDGDVIINGMLILDGVHRILVDDKEVPEFVMAGDDGEILELDELRGPVLRMFVIWTAHASHDETQSLYLIESKGMRWEADE
jgi:transposase-like protein